MYLPDALWAYRKSPKSTTGFSPFSLVYGIEVVSPAEIMTPSLGRKRKKGKESSQQKGLRTWKNLMKRGKKPRSAAADTCRR